MQFTDMRTPEQLRASAEQQFAFILERFDMLDLTEADAQEQVRLGRLLFEYALTMPAGEVLDWKTALPGEPDGPETMRLVIRVMPFIASSLNLLVWEFQHPQAGLVPMELVGKLLGNSPEPVFLGDVELTTDKVFMQYRRR